MASLAEDRRVTGSLTDDWDGTGTEPADTAVTVALPAMGTVAAHLTGTFTGTITWEMSVNGTTFEAVSAMKLSTKALATTATTTGIYFIAAPGAVYVRARCSAFTSGPIAVTLNGSVSPLDFSSMGGVALGTVDTEMPAAVTIDANNGNSIPVMPQIEAVLAGYDAGASAAKMLRTANNFTDGAAGGTILVNAAAFRNSAETGYSVPTLDALEQIPVRSSGYAKKPTITLTRGANTTPYTIGDEVATASTAPTAITVSRTTAGTGWILGGRIVYSNAPAVTPDLIVLVFQDTVTLAGDNEQLNLSDAHAAKCIGILYTQRAQPGVYSAGAASTSGSLIIGLAPVAPIAFEATAATSTLFLAVVTLNAFTPIANSETLQISLDLDRD